MFSFFRGLSGRDKNHQFMPPPAIISRKKTDLSEVPSPVGKDTRGHTVTVKKEEPTFKTFKEKMGFYRKEKTFQPGLHRVQLPLKEGEIKQPDKTKSPVKSILKKEGEESTKPRRKVEFNETAQARVVDVVKNVPLDVAGGVTLQGGATQAPSFAKSVREQRDEKGERVFTSPKEYERIEVSKNQQLTQKEQFFNKNLKYFITVKNGTSDDLNLDYMKALLFPIIDKLEKKCEKEGKDFSLTNKEIREELTEEWSAAFDKTPPKKREIRDQEGNLVTKKYTRERASRGVQPKDRLSITRSKYNPEELQDIKSRYAEALNAALIQPNLKNLE